jgi:hypothetical protein
MSEDEAWNALVAAAREWANHMDQWQKFKFETEFGTVYVSLTRCEQYADDFNQVGLQPIGDVVRPIVERAK